MENVKRKQMGTMPMTKTDTYYVVARNFSMTIMAMYTKLIIFSIGQYSQKD